MEFRGSTPRAQQSCRAPATTLVISVFNGVVYGVIAWSIYTIVIAMTGRGKQKQTIQQTVNVNVQEKKTEEQKN
jgi:hypothetical protein